MDLIDFLVAAISDGANNIYIYIYFNLLMK